jgi:hypothetical protein
MIDNKYKHKKDIMINNINFGGNKNKIEKKIDSLIELLDIRFLNEETKLDKLQLDAITNNNTQKHPYEPLLYDIQAHPIHDDNVQYKINSINRQNILINLIKILNQNDNIFNDVENNQLSNKLSVSSVPISSVPISSVPAYLLNVNKTDNYIHLVNNLKNPVYNMDDFFIEDIKRNRENQIQFKYIKLSSNYDLNLQKCIKMELNKTKEFEQLDNNIINYGQQIDIHNKLLTSLEKDLVFYQKKYEQLNKPYYFSNDNQTNTLITIKDITHHILENLNNTKTLKEVYDIIQKQLQNLEKLKENEKIMVKIENDKYDKETDNLIKLEKDQIQQDITNNIKKIEKDIEDISKEKEKLKKDKNDFINMNQPYLTDFNSKLEHFKLLVPKGKNTRTINNITKIIKKYNEDIDNNNFIKAYNVLKVIRDQIIMNIDSKIDGFYKDNLEIFEETIKRNNNITKKIDELIKEKTNTIKLLNYNLEILYNQTFNDNNTKAYKERNYDAKNRYIDNLLKDIRNQINYGDKINYVFSKEIGFFDGIELMNANTIELLIDEKIEEIKKKIFNEKNEIIMYQEKYNKNKQKYDNDTKDIIIEITKTKKKELDDKIKAYKKKIIYSWNKITPKTYNELTLLQNKINNEIKEIDNKLDQLDKLDQYGGFLPENLISNLTSSYKNTNKLQNELKQLGIKLNSSIPIYQEQMYNTKDNLELKCKKQVLEFQNVKINTYKFIYENESNISTILTKYDIDNIINKVKVKVNSDRINNEDIITKRSIVCCEFINEFLKDDQYIDIAKSKAISDIMMLLFFQKNIL